jgi:hypothetical protein
VCNGCVPLSKFFHRFGLPDVGDETVVTMAATLLTDETCVPE